MISHRCSYLGSKLLCYPCFQKRVPKAVQKPCCYTAIHPQMLQRQSFCNKPQPNAPSLSRQSKRHCCTDFRSLWKRAAVGKYLQSLKKEYQHISSKMNDFLLSESDRRALSKRHVELSPLTAILQEITAAEREAQELDSIYKNMESENDEQMLELAVEEREQISRRIELLQKKLFQSLVPKDKHDKSDVILEVTSGRTTGGDICQQFSKEIFEMYQNYADYKFWQFEVLNYMPAEYGGLHHAAVRISGECVYKYLKYEGGTHRVQRIPEVGLSSRMQRIHTGTMTVIVLPQPDEVTVKINPKDLRIDTFRAKGAGGQHVNTTDSAVRIVHIPTRIAVECQQERSQLQNRETALRMMRAKLYQQLIQKEVEQRQSTRKVQVGTRAQSERIRTYNFTQDRVTDHRISYVVRDIKEFLCGGMLLDELINELVESAEMEALLDLIENNRTFATEKI
ncbi:peptide chain release factor 1, mitochondrial [Latimeria chalumnae]|uniref:peptide chain release factor 1, mitochondrial n=1 Tax=Latimeria chalumnae TaxID=7897 RepID=UPI0003C18764